MQCQAALNFSHLNLNREACWIFQRGYLFFSPEEKWTPRSLNSGFAYRGGLMELMIVEFVSISRFHEICMPEVLELVYYNIQAS